ncbi:hypothetical protein PIB30_076400 [Stylosanthes scabra]|uniref:Uncharacterized protein n=1 Tax=Stylosanthes scabra TaxID=79078 RepID=A0ABU6RQJ1_9FABA|nr:hypothetical protein [Stylosanthes scabra]
MSRHAENLDVTHMDLDSEGDSLWFLDDLIRYPEYSSTHTGHDSALGSPDDSSNQQSNIRTLARRLPSTLRHWLALRICARESSIVISRVVSPEGPPCIIDFGSKRDITTIIASYPKIQNALMRRFIWVEKSMRKDKKNIGSKNGLEKACKSRDFTKKEECKAEKRSYSHRIGGNLDPLEI